MATSEQLEFIDSFDTSRPSNPLFCHQEFLEKLAQHGKDAIGRRTSFLLQRLSVDARRLHYKSTQGVNRGWRRSRLGGNHGSHFYAWWAPKNAAPLKEAGDFTSIPDGAVVLRDIRHHDDHSPLNAQSFDANYMPVTVRDLRRAEYAPQPWTQNQVRFASARQPVRLLKGHPGSGKTTALWHAADSAGAERVLYVTYSHDLASLAREYFDRFCSSHKQFDVVTFPNLIRRILRSDAPVPPNDAEAKRRFRSELLPFARTLGPWMGGPIALFDEMYAHLVGDALPVSVGRFTTCKQPRVPDAAFRDRRTRFLGQQATTAALEAANRLERLDSTPLADKYFPELALAWRALAVLQQSGPDTSLLEYDCVAVDEVQDLTPLEALILIELTSLNNKQHHAPIPLLLAGDEAQTVRPTDFEWAWLSDMLHARLGTPAEHKLAANLRSPQRIAELVNRVWDLYSHIQKQERPSGTGYAEIDDDATDQVLYCTAAPGPELDELLTSLSSREGLALITMEEKIPAWVPEAARGAVLTPSEAKGLDFHSVCVLDAGRQIERIVKTDARMRPTAEIMDIQKRLGIDQLRVALSRPTERLFWVDISPTDSIVRGSLDFLNGRATDPSVSSSVPAAILKTLEEDELDPEERVQRCQSDARQYLQVRPELAWSRAQQAITLLGRPGSMASVTDEAARDSAHLTLAEICFTLAVRNANLPAELGRPDLFHEAQRGASGARRYGLAAVIDAVARVFRATVENRLQLLVDLANVVPQRKGELEPWVLTELGAKIPVWIEELEAALFNGHNASVLIRLLPPFYEALGIADRAARTSRLQQRAIQLLIKDKQFGQALAALRALPERQPKLEAVCLEGMGDFRGAAEAHIAVGNTKEALNCYRSIPDMEAALKLVLEIGDHPAAQSLQWISRLQGLVAERPEKFTKVVTTAEKKVLEDLLERALGVTRRKPAPRKAAAKKTAGKKAAAKKAAAKRPRTRRPFPDPFF